MSHELFYVQPQSHRTQTFIHVGGGVSSAIIIGLALHWQGRHELPK